MAQTPQQTPDLQPASGGAVRYDAFISYRHTEPDRAWARWLHTALETYRTPRVLVRRGIGPRLGRVFRDEDELPADPSLNDSIRNALDASRFLIVVCSPRTPQSRWVNAEVERFRELGRHDRILALLIEGEPGDAFPVALHQVRTRITSPVGDAVERIEEVEPLAADVRPRPGESSRTLKRLARMRLMACLLGVRFDDLRQREHERRQRRAAILTVGSLTLAGAMAVMAVVAVQQKREADRQRFLAQTNEALAVKREHSAERAASFLELLISKADPSLLGDPRASLQDALRSGVGLLESAEYRDEPTLRARLQNQLGVMLYSLGDEKSAEPLLRAALASADAGAELDAPRRGKLLMNLGLIELSRGSSDKAIELLERAAQFTPAIESSDAFSGIMQLSNLCNAHATLGNFDRAAEYGRQALARCEQFPGGQTPFTSLVLQNLGGAVAGQGRTDEAEQFLRRGITMHDELFHSPRPVLVNLLSSLGVMMQNKGDLAQAEQLLVRAQEAADKVFPGPARAKALVLSNLGVLRERQNNEDEAEPLFTQAVEMFRRSDADRTEDAAVCFTNLGLLEAKQGAYKSGLAHLQSALDARIATWGENSAKVGEALRALGGTMTEAKQPKEAIPILERACTVWKQLCAGGPCPSLAECQVNLAEAFAGAGRKAEAVDMYAQAAASFAACDPSPSIIDGRAMALIERAALLRDDAPIDQATAAHEQAVEAVIKCTIPRGWRAGRLHEDHAGVLSRAGKHAEARKELELALEIREGIKPLDQSELARILSNLVVVRANAGDRKAAAEALQRAEELASKLPESSPVKAQVRQIGTGFRAAEPKPAAGDPERSR